MVILVGGVVAVAAAGITRYTPSATILAFVCSTVGVAIMAALIARSVEQLGDRLGAGATGVLQSAVGNLPSLVLGFFALRAGMLRVVQYAIIGSILANLLLMLGATFLVGGLRNGPQRFERVRCSDFSVLLILATAALLLPSVAQLTHSPAASHLQLLSNITAVVLLIIFFLSLPSAVSRRRRRPPSPLAAGAVPGMPRWPLWLAISLLIAAGTASVVTSDWLVRALQPGATALHISEAFVGLVIVGFAGNAVQNVVGLQLAFRNQSDYALSVVIHSPLQAALLVAPALTLLSLTTATTLTLVFAPMLAVGVTLAVVVVTLTVLDSESNWLEGAVLMGLYAIFAAVFWWG